MTSETELRLPIQFTKEKLQTFETLYKRALAEGRDVFHFEGHPLFVGYAKYVIEYLKSQGL